MPGFVGFWRCEILKRILGQLDHLGGLTATTAVFLGSYETLTSYNQAYSRIYPPLLPEFALVRTAILVDCV